jgi:hypothetical protein
MYRLALPTVERPQEETFYEGWKSVIGLANEMTGRANYPEGALSMIRGLFSVSCQITMTAKKPEDPNSVFCGVTNRWYVSLPQTCLHLPQFGGIPFPTTLLPENIVTADSSGALRGDACWFNVMRRVRTENVPDYLMRIDYTKKSHGAEVRAAAQGKLKLATRQTINAKCWNALDLTRAIAYDSYRQRQVIDDAILEDKSIANILKYSKETLQTLQSGSFQKAMRAKIELNPYDIRVPPSIDQTMTAELRMRDALASFKKTTEVWRAYDRSLEDVYKKGVLKLKGKIVLPEPMNLFFVNWKVSDEGVAYQRTGSIIPEVAITPPAMGSPYFRNEYIRSGTSNSLKVGSLSRLNAALAGHYGDNKTDEINQVLRQINKKPLDDKYRVLQLVIDVMGLNDSEAAEFRMLAEDNHMSSSSPSQITNVPRATPWLNTDSRSVCNSTIMMKYTDSYMINRIREMVGVVIERSIGPYHGMKRIEIEFPTFMTGYVAHLLSRVPSK